MTGTTGRAAPRRRTSRPAPRHATRYRPRHRAAPSIWAQTAWCVAGGALILGFAGFTWTIAVVDVARQLGLIDERQTP